MEISPEIITAILTLAAACLTGASITSIKWLRVARVAGEAIDLLKTAKDAWADKQLSEEEKAQILKDIEELIQAWES